MADCRECGRPLLYSGRDPRALDGEPGNTSDLIEFLREKLAQTETLLKAAETSPKDNLRTGKTRTKRNSTGGEP